jgi:hypothetical protein
MARRRTPPALARRIDRLARRAHAFHRFAHHPLCAAYAGEVVRLGRRARVCRGCALAVCGLVGGAAAGLALPANVAAVAALAAAGAALAALGAAPRRGAHRSKLAGRALPAALLAAVVAHAARHPAWLALAAALAAVAAAALAVRAYRRRGPDRSACTACPERMLDRACSGYRPIVRRERAFARAAARLLAREA